MVGRTDVAGVGIEVVELGPDDWRRWRGVRLRSLATDPAAFSSTFERQRTFPEEAWRRRLTGGPRVVAERDGVDVGLAGAHLADGPDQPQLYGMWVDPDHRGAGIGAALVEAVVERLAAAGHDHVRLWVESGNDGARRLYTRRGFRPEPDPPTPSPGSCELAMLRTWTSSSGDAGGSTW